MNKLAMSLCSAYDMFASLVSSGPDCPCYPAPVTELLSRRLRHRHRHRHRHTHFYRHTHGEYVKVRNTSISNFSAILQAANESWTNCRSRLKTHTNLRHIEAESGLECSSWAQEAQWEWVISWQRSAKILKLIWIEFAFNGTQQIRSWTQNKLEWKLNIII